MLAAHRGQLPTSSDSLMLSFMCIMILSRTIRLLIYIIINIYIHTHAHTHNTPHTQRGGEGGRELFKTK